MKETFIPTFQQLSEKEKRLVQLKFIFLLRNLEKVSLIKKKILSAIQIYVHILDLGEKA